jgi:membrane protease YdiL (CAAX protease family)
MPGPPADPGPPAPPRARAEPGSPGSTPVTAAATPAGRGVAGCAPLVPLGIAVAALGAVVLIPNLYSDPNGLDPYVLRASGVAVALLGVTLLVPGLAGSRLVMAGLVAVALGWSAFAGTSTLLYDLGLHQQTGDQANLYESLAWVVVTVLVLGAVRLAVRRDRPALRLLRFGRGAIAVSVGGTALFFLVVMLIPAPLLGREGLPVVALGRDAPWLVPANLLQGLAQELQFRGLLLGSLERLTTPQRANLAQAVVFGLAHLAIVYQGPIAPFVPLTMVLGYLLGLATQRTRSLWPAIIVHGVADVAATLGVLPGLYGF